MIPTRRRPVADRSSERRIVLAGIGLAALFLLLALLSLALPDATRRVYWLPLHLALAGGASTAIAAVMPFFSAALAAAPPSDRRLRAAALGCISGGALGVAIGVAAFAPWLAVAGGITFVGGCILTAIAMLAPLRRGLGPSRGIVTIAYTAALADIGVGATLATLYLAGWEPLVEAWPAGKLAHAWLNLVGFVSLVIAATLLHFFPTVVGARIAVRPTARAAVWGLVVGAPLTALGALVGSSPAAAAGAILLVVGATSLSAYAVQTWQTRGRWTSDQAWHLFAIGGLASAIAWFDLGIALAAGRLLVSGPGLAGWSLASIIAPLVGGWAGLAVLASATHLLPAVGPGRPEIHAAQRRLLGTSALLRLVALDAGIACLTVGLNIDGGPWLAAGLALVTVGFGATLILIAGAIAAGMGAATTR